MAIERNNCHQGTTSGTPFAIRPIITIGDVNGIMLPQNAIGLSGFSIDVLKIINPKTIGIMIGSIRDCASCGSSLTALPTAANKEA